jgi:hypothetical protein
MECRNSVWECTVTGSGQDAGLPPAYDAGLPPDPSDAGLPPESDAGSVPDPQDAGDPPTTAAQECFRALGVLSCGYPCPQGSASCGMWSDDVAIVNDCIDGTWVCSQDTDGVIDPGVMMVNG